MTFVPLCLSHQSIIQEACRSLRLPLCEYNFATLYLFRKTDQYFFREDSRGYHWVRGVSQHGTLFLMPLFHPVDWQESIAFAKECGAQYLFPICEEWVNELSVYQTQFDDTEADYCFEREAIQNYAGRRFDGQRNWVKRLLHAHTMRVEPYRVDRVDAANAIIEAWCVNKGNGYADAAECKEGALLADTLGLEGYLFFADEKPVGFILGGYLLEEMFLVHFAKAVSGFSGIYQYMYQELAKRLPACIRWLNWEQDLGIETLRKAKKAYHPTLLLKKAQLFIDKQRP